MTEGICYARESKIDERWGGCEEGRQTDAESQTDTPIDDTRGREKGGDGGGEATTY